MSHLPWKTFGLTALSVLVLSGCVVRERSYGYYGPRHRAVIVEPAPVVVAPAPPPVAQGEIVVNAAPPPVQVEVIPVAPGPAFIWVPGAWVWHGRWVWEGGRWSLPPRRGAVWVPHHYVYRNGVHVWVQGGWR